MVGWWGGGGGGCCHCGTLLAVPPAVTPLVCAPFRSMNVNPLPGWSRMALRSNVVPAAGLILLAWSLWWAAKAYPYETLTDVSSCIGADSVRRPPGMHGSCGANHPRPAAIAPPLLREERAACARWLHRPPRVRPFLSGRPLRPAVPLAREPPKGPLTRLDVPCGAGFLPYQSVDTDREERRQRCIGVRVGVVAGIVDAGHLEALPDAVELGVGVVAIDGPHVAPCVGQLDLRRAPSNERPHRSNSRQPSLVRTPAK